MADNGAGGRLIVVVLLLLHLLITIIIRHARAFALVVRRRARDHLTHAHQLIARARELTLQPRHLLL